MIPVLSVFQRPGACIRKKTIYASPLGERLGADRIFFNLFKVLERWEEQREGGDVSGARVSQEK